MPRIRCNYLDCVFNDDGLCSASIVEIDPDAGCITYSRAGNLLRDDEWDDEDFDNETWEDMGYEEEDEDEWFDEEDDDDEDDF